MTLVRLGLYFVDALSTRVAAEKALLSNADVVIFDRYIYDELANLNLRNSFIRTYARLILNVVPLPDISFVLDADPVQARARKPEYPIEFLWINRQSYLDLSKFVKGAVVVPARPLDEMKSTVLQSGLRLFGIESDTGPSQKDVIGWNNSDQTVKLERV
jgi:thymidylate kinase